jgi:hypothetical protein
MTDYFAELLKIMPLPEKPEERGITSDWEVIEKKLGTKLPDDYKAYINSFGSGVICGDLWVYNPFSDAQGLKLEAIENILAMYRVMEEGLPKEFSYSFYPEKEGLLPCAGSEQSFFLMWHTVGEPNDWPIVVMDFVDMSERATSYSLTEFIIKYLRKEIEIVKTDHICQTVFTPRSQWKP